MSEEPRRGPGQPTLYNPDFAEQARKLCAFGATMKEIAEFIGVAPKTIRNWQTAHPEFREAIGSSEPARLRALTHRLEQAHARTSKTRRAHSQNR